MGHVTLEDLFRAIAERRRDAVLGMLDDAPHLATGAAAAGATRADAPAHFLEPIARYIYAGDTALHIAAAAYDVALIDRLLALGANANARNRLGASALHAASDGRPGAADWQSELQVKTIERLIAAGVDANTADKRGVTPLHRAIRARCSAAAGALLSHGADPHRTNRAGSTPLRLATSATGRGGSGSPAAKAEQSEIVKLLKARLASAG